MSGLTEKKIQKALFKSYEKSSVFLGCNMYVYMEESDFFVITKSGYFVEFEVKITRADYKNDFTHKYKHQLIDLKRKRETHWIPKGKKRKRLIEVPNKFYFVVPEGMLTVEEVPFYAGLIYIDRYGCPATIKNPSFIHKEKFNKFDYLARKYYNRYLEQLKEKLK